MASNPREAANSNDYVPSHLLAPDGNPYLRRAYDPAGESNKISKASGSGDGDNPMTHIKWLERGMIALGICLLALAGVTWHGYDNLTTQTTGLAVNQKELAGKVDTLDAKLSGKLDLIGQRLDDDAKRSSGAGSPK